MKYLFEDLGRASNKIAQKLDKNQTIDRLLKYTDDNPLSSDLDDWDQSISLIGSNIIVIPRADLTKNKESYIVISIPNFSNDTNMDFTAAEVQIAVLCPMDKWQIDDITPRPYKIMSEIYEELQDSRVTGIGTLQFQNVVMSDPYQEFTSHVMIFEATANG